MFGLEKLGSLGQGANDAPSIMSKEEVERRRKVAQALMEKATDTSPVQHWTQGAARIVQALDASIGDYQANKADREAQAEGRRLSEGLFGSGATASLPQPTMTSGVAPPSAPSAPSADGDTSTAFLDTLKSNGITNPHALAAVGATGYHESRWSPGNLNRTWDDPSQSGQAGTAGGALSWRGPRLQALQAFAASQGEQGNGSAATQAKFFAQEDPQLIQRLNAAKTPEEAMGLMNNAWRYAGYDKPDGETAARMASVRQWSSRVAPLGAGDPSRATPDAVPGQAVPPVQVAQAGPGVPQTAAPQTGGAPSLAKLLAIQNSPAFDRMPAGSQAVVKALIAKQVGQETKDPLDQEQKRLNIQKLQNDLANSGLSKRQQELAIQKAEQDLQRKPNIEIIRDAATGEIIAVDKNDIGSGVRKLREGGPSKDAPTTKNIKQPDGSEVAVQWNAETRAWEPLKAPEGGNAVKAPGKLTEQQSKDLVYYDRGSQALAMLDEIGADALAAPSDAIKSKVPLVGNMLVSEKFQQAKQAGTNFLASILRKDSGAAITANEEEIYGRVFLPQPGDGPAVLQQKTAARRQAMDAIRNGLGPAEVLAIGSRLTKREDAKTPKPDDAKPAQTPKRAPANDPLGLFQ